MKKVLLLLLLWLALPSVALALSPEELPPVAEELLEEAGREESGIPDFTKGLSLLWEWVCEIFGDVVRQSLRGAVLLLGVVFLCALAEDCVGASGGGVLPVATATGVMAITLIAAGDLQSLMGLGVETMGELNIVSKSILPTLMMSLAVSGGAVSASVRHVAAVFFSDVLMTVIETVLLPLVYVYVAASAADAMLPGRRLKAIASAISKGTTWLLSGALVAYTAYLTLSGVAAGSADALALQLTQSAMGAVPVVGSIISGAATTVLSGATVLRHSVGIGGILAVLAVCLVPFLRLAVQYLLYKLTAFLASTMAPSGIAELIDALSRAFGLVLGMTGACATLLLISLCTAVMVVTT